MNPFDPSNYRRLFGRRNKINLTQRGLFDQNYPISDINFPVSILGGVESETGVNVTVSNSLTIWAVYACVEKISTTIASLPFKVHQKDGKRTETLYDHEIASLIGRAPNDNQTAFDFWEDIISRALLYGEGVAFISRDGSGTATSLKILKNTDFSKVENDNGVFYRINGSHELISPMDLLIIPAFRHISPIALHRETLGQSIAQTEFASKFFKQGATSRGFFSTDHVFQDEQTRKANEADLQNATTGLKNAHKPPLFGANIKYNSMAIPQRDAQYVETTKLTAQQICSIYGVPPFKIQLDTNQTYSNTEQQNIAYVVDTIVPWQTRIEHELNQKLLPSRDTSIYTKIHEQALLRGDIQARGEYYDKMLKNGTFTINDVREKEDMNPVEGGDVNLVQVNQIPLSNIEDYGDKISKTESNE